jgi:hypothetical protein
LAKKQFIEDNLLYSRMQREGLYSWENPAEHEQICHANVWQCDGGAIS